MASANSPPGLWVELLGPIEAWVDGRQVALGGQRPRALLAILALTPGRVVRSERLIDELWGEAPPAHARAGLQVLVSRLRKALTEAGGDSERLASRAGGYSLQLGTGAADTDRWPAALRRAREERAAGRLEAARIAIEDALAMWRGSPLEGACVHALLAGERARLDEEHLAAVTEGLELDLQLGRHGELLGQLDALVLAHPFKERLVELQMIALYRCGRQSDALAAFQAARRRLVDELGIEPAEPLRELHDDVLRHADTLGGAPRPAPPAVRIKCGLPVPPNRTIGRQREIDAIGERLRSGSLRLLTLTGPGGVGKTRLAVEAGRAVEQEFADGACFVSLGALQRAEDVPATIATALGVIVLAGESPAKALERFLAAGHLLLVIDNFEQVMPAAPLLGRLLKECTALTVIVTSREPLSLYAEERQAVPPLALPDARVLNDPAALERVAAVALYCERARAHDPDFKLDAADSLAVAEICQRLDGLPLAIELAAARSAVLAPAEIAQRLGATLDALGAGPRDAPARHHTLRATIDWSRDLLSETERQCFDRFAVLVGSATVEAAERITRGELDTLDALVAKSMLIRRQQAGAPTRLAMLETIRARAAVHFAATADAEAVRERHHRYYLDFAERHGGERSLWRADRTMHLATLDAELLNLHAACAWAIDRGRAEPALQLCAALGPYWLLRNRYDEALEWIDRALAALGADTPAALRVRVLCDKTWCLWALGRGGERGPVLDEAEAMARRLGDPGLVAHVLGTRAIYAAAAGRLQLAAKFADQALHCATTADDDWAIAIAASARALASNTAAELRERVDAAAALLERVGNTYTLGGLLTSAAYVALRDGSHHAALELAARATPIVRELDDPYEWMLLHGNLALAKLLTGDPDAADDSFRVQLKLCRKLGVRPPASEGLLGRAAVAAAAGDRDRAARLLGASATHRYGARQDEIETKLAAAFFDSARHRYGPDAWDAAVREGAALDYEVAIAYALDEIDSVPSHH